MPQEIKQLIGALDLDSPIETIEKGFHRDARNIVFRGIPPNRRAEYVPGNTVKNNPLLPGSGVNKTIMAKYDSKNMCVYIFNFNSIGNHGIYKYNTITDTFQRLVEVGINTNGDVLGFTADSLHNLDILYGDSTQGDIIYWLDSQGRPSKINVNRAVSGGYGTIDRSFLNVCRQPASIPPICAYERDASNTVNNLRKKLFKFKIRWVFDDKDKSVTSSQCSMPLPFDPFDQTIDTDPTFNCRISIVYQTGPPNVKKIEILGAVTIGNSFSDFFLVSSIDKSVSGLSNNDLGTFLFYNDRAYNYIDLTESIQLFDYVPDMAGAQTILNGNVPSYGNITEGRPNLTSFSNGSNTSGITASQVPYYYGDTFSRLVSSQSGDSGFGSGNIHIVVRGYILTTFTTDTYAVYMTDGTNITYTTSIGDDSSAVIEGLRVNALSKGYTIISNGNNDLIVFKSNISLARSFITSNYAYNAAFNSSFYAYDWLGKHGWGLTYFDENGKTNGTVYTDGFSVSSPSYTEGYAGGDKPVFNASVWHRPPDWAYYYQWVRTKDLKKSKFQQWVSDRTFKDLSSLSGQVKYAYVSIQSLNVFINANPGSPLGYTFSAGDRITFFKRYNEDGTTAILYGNSKDFEIAATVVDPTINGEIKIGEFVKIILPPTDGNFDFGASAYNNYFIEMYTPAQSVANGLDVYYEYGQRYKIGNPTQSNRFHQGMTQNQSEDLITDATFQFMEGDFYIKQRAVQTGNEYLFNIPEMTITGADFIIIGINLVSKTYDDPNITTQSQSYVGMPAFNPFTDGRWFLGANTVTDFHIKGTISFSFATAQTGSAWDIYIQNRFGEKKYLISSNVEGAGVYSFSFDTVTTLEDDHIFLLAQGSSVRTIKFLSSNITFTIDRIVNQKMIDQNFSDYFPSAVNSNGRAFIYEPDANRVTFPTMFRWGGAFQKDTSINNSNRFYPENFDNIDRGYGAIMAMKNWNRLLTFFQERKCGQTGIYQKFITDSGGNNQLITTDSIIASNNISYYDGDYGVYNQPASIVQSGYVYYFVDPIKNKILRLSKDGLTDLTELYKVQTWAGNNLPKYLNPGTYQFGGNQKVLGVFNVRPDKVDEYLLLAQGTAIAPGEVFGFEESYNSFYSKIDIDCDCMVCAETTLLFFRNGIMWKQSTSVSYNSFFGISKQASITVVFNESAAVKKLFDATGYMSNFTWMNDTKGDIETNVINSQTGQSQQSLIMTDDYDTVESPKRYAAFNFDMNSGPNQILALWEGDKLNGEIITCKYKGGAGVNSYFFAPFINYQIDNRNP